jgi:hypothetical protein
VLIYQHIGTTGVGGPSDVAHVARLSCGRGVSPAGIAALLAGLVLGDLGNLLAQSRGDLQVGANILASGPSQTALAAALHAPSAGPDPVLVSIRRELLRAPTDADRTARRPRAVITIEFLHN